MGGGNAALRRGVDGGVRVQHHRALRLRLGLLRSGVGTRALVQLPAARGRAGCGASGQRLRLRLLLLLLLRPHVVIAGRAVARPVAAGDGRPPRMRGSGPAPTPEMTTAAAMTETVVVDLRRIGRAGVIGAVAVGVMPPLGVANASKCGNNSSADCQRSAGCFSKHFRMRSLSGADTCSRCFVTGSTGSLTWAARIIWGEVPVNGGRPVSNS